MHLVLHLDVKITIVPSMHPDIKAGRVVLRHKDVDGLLEFVFKLRDFVVAVQLEQAVEHVADCILVIHQDAEGRRVFWQQEFLAALVRDDVLLGRLAYIFFRHIYFLSC